MSLAAATSPALSASFHVRPRACISHVADQPSCSFVTQLSSSGRREVVGLRTKVQLRQITWPCPRLNSGERRRRFATAAAPSSPEVTRFPFFSGSSRTLLLEITETLDKELGTHLVATETPSDVRYFKSADGNAEGSITLRAGKDSKVDFTLESWLHATLPFGSLDIGTVVIMLGSELDSPHFLFEFILSGPTLVVVLDHLPRKDLVLDPAYLKRFYEDTELDKVRQIFEKAPDSKPYVSSVLFIRTVVSPTAVVFRISNNTDVEGGLLDEQIESVVHPGATKAFQIWLDSFRTRGLQVQNLGEMLKRDNEIKEKGVEVDLSANLPRIFGPDITSRIVEAFRAGK